MNGVTRAMMNRIYTPSCGLAAWRARLADPEKHWKRWASAFEAAVSWELAAHSERGLPPAIAKVIDQEPTFAGATLLFAFPEHKVMLPGGGHASQTDVWAVLKGPSGLISMAVEAKADETFGDTIEKWGKDASPGKRERMEHLLDILKCPSGFPDEIRYQLLHRTASAIIEAHRIGASHAVMMVQSFRENSPSAADFIAFGKCLGAKLAAGRLCRLDRHTDPAVYLGWATSELCTDGDIARVSE